ncbi:MAG: tRNA (adenosine(37)-N6)-threonylcarbamoyltransferase complex ATPase subunit type 1 TsaE [Planctomycetota bacterium]
MSGGAFQFESGSLADTVALGRTIGALAEVGDVIALDGQLGAGKTQLVRGLAEGMGLNPRDVSSPTFVFVQEYASSDEEEAPVLVHIDAYRLASAEQLDSIGWSDELLDGAVLAVEWAPRIAAALGADRLDIRIEHLGEGHRSITLEASGSWVSRFAALRAKVTT